ncbi:MAG TPA: hypothetical protein VGC45_08145 [Gryllotalpicola sp.]
MPAEHDDARDDARKDEQPQGDALLSRLRLIEDQPLETRAEAYAHVHGELRDALDAADRQGGR